MIIAIFFLTFVNYFLALYQCATFTCLDSQPMKQDNNNDTSKPHAIWQQILLGNTSNWFIQLLRYTIVGGIAYIVDFGLLFLLTEYAGLHYLLSATISFIAGLVVNYLISREWVFGSSKLSNQWAEFAIYAFIGIIGLVLNLALLYVFTEWLNIYYLLSKIFTAALVMLWNFFARRLLYKNK